MMTDTNRVLVACIGNIFLGDDGFGCEVAQSLCHIDLPCSVTVFDYGIRGLDLAYALLEPWTAVILVDTVSRGGPPGALYLLQPSEVAAPAPSTLDAHSLDPARILALARSLGPVTADIYILGCEPRDFGEELEGRMGLSPEVAAAIPAAVTMIRQTLTTLARNPSPHALSSGLSIR